MGFIDTVEASGVDVRAFTEMGIALVFIGLYIIIIPGICHLSQMSHCWFCCKFYVYILFYSLKKL